MATASHRPGWLDQRPGHTAAAGVLIFLLGSLGVPSYLTALYWAIGAGCLLALGSLGPILLPRLKRYRLAGSEILQGGGFLLAALVTLHAFRLWAESMGGLGALTEL